MCLTIILILLLFSGSTESKSCQVYPTTVRRLPQNSCCENLLQGRENIGDGKLLLVVTGTTLFLNPMRGKPIVITSDEINNSNPSRLPLKCLNACCGQQSTSLSANCESSDPEEKEDASFSTIVTILSFLVCVLGFTVAVLAVALYRTRRTKRTARLPLPPPPGPPVLQVANHDYSTVYEELPNVDGVKTQGEQNRLTETHKRYTLSGLINTDRVPNRIKTREAVTIKEVQKTVDIATSSSEEHMYSVLEKEIEEVRSDGTYSIDKEGTYHVLEDCLPEKDQDQKEEEGHYHVLDPEALSIEEVSTEEQTC